MSKMNLMTTRIIDDNIDTRAVTRFEKWIRYMSFSSSTVSESRKTHGPCQDSRIIRNGTN